MLYSDLLLIQTIVPNEPSKCTQVKCDVGNVQIVVSELQHTIEDIVLETEVYIWMLSGHRQHDEQSWRFSNVPGRKMGGEFHWNFEKIYDKTTFQVGKTEQMFPKGVVCSESEYLKYIIIIFACFSPQLWKL